LAPRAALDPTRDTRYARGQVGLRAGDRVVAVNERSVWQAVQLRDLLAEKMQKGPTFLLLEREGAYRQVVFGLPAHPRGSPQPASRAPSSPFVQDDMQQASFIYSPRFRSSTSGRPIR